MCRYTGPSEEAVTKLLRSLASVIVTWNTTHKFDLKKSSSVVFVEELLKVFGKTLLLRDLNRFFFFFLKGGVCKNCDFRSNQGMSVMQLFVL